MSLFCILIATTLGQPVPGLDGLTTEELEAVQAIRSRNRDRRQEPVPSVRTQGGNVVVTAGAGGDVSFIVNGTSISVSELPGSLRSYTDATVDALGLGFNIGQAAGTVAGENAALRIESALQAQITGISSSVTGLSSSINDNTATTGTLGARVATVEQALTRSATAADLVALNASLTAVLRTTAGAPLGSVFNPAISCRHILEARPDAVTSYYTLKFSGTNAPYKVKCDMTTEGGGWTRFHWIRQGDGGGFLARDQFYRSNFRGNRKCLQEDIDFGHWTFSRNAMENSWNNLLMIDAEVTSQFNNRYHMYRFNHTASCRGNNFFKAVTGDYRGCTNAQIWDFSTSDWVVTRRGVCNTNQHTQFNCYPQFGVRGHYAVRDCGLDGGGVPPVDGWGYWTGFNACCGVPQDNSVMNRLVKNWNNQWNKVATDVLYR